MAVDRAVANGAGLVAFPLLLYAYMPRPSVSGAHLLAYPAMGAALGVLLLYFLSRRQALDPRIPRLCILLLLLNTVVVASFIINAPGLRVTAPTEVLRVFLIAIFMLYGYWIARSAGEDVVHSGLLAAAYIILAGQALIAITQLADIPLFDEIYSGDKSRPIGKLFRASGSLANPNAFAWIVSQAGVMAFVLESRARRYLALFTTVLLVMVSGSRTLLLLFPCMIVYASIIARPGRRKVVLYIGLGALIATLFVGAIYYLGEYLRYLAQLELIIASGSLRSISSFDARVINWQETFVEFASGSWGVWLIGLGARQSTAVLDNDFLYMLFKFGIVGFLTHLWIICYTMCLLMRARRRPIVTIGMQYLLFALVFGLVSETLGGWAVPLVLYLLLGLAIGLQAGGWQPLARAKQSP